MAEKAEKATEEVAVKNTEKKAAVMRTRVGPTASASQAATGCTKNWMMATTNRQSRTSVRLRPIVWVVYDSMKVLVK